MWSLHSPWNKLEDIYLTSRLVPRGLMKEKMEHEVHILRSSSLHLRSEQNPQQQSVAKAAIYVFGTDAHIMPRSGETHHS